MRTQHQRLRARDHESYGMFTVLAILLAPVGLLMGIIYLAKSDPIDRKLGEHLIAFSVLVLIISSILWYVFVPQQYTTTTAPTYDTSTVAPTWDMDAAYEQIAQGMSKEEVALITEQSPQNCGESISGGSTYESCSYGTASSTGGGIIQVNYVDGVVTSKGKTSL